MAHSLGVDRSVRVVERSDDVVGEPGARHDGTQTCRQTTDQNPRETVGQRPVSVGPAQSSGLDPREADEWDESPLNWRSNIPSPRGRCCVLVFCSFLCFIYLLLEWTPIPTERQDFKMCCNNRSSWICPNTELSSSLLQSSLKEFWSRGGGVIWLLLSITSYLSSRSKSFHSPPLLSSETKRLSHSTLVKLRKNYMI